MIIGIVAIAQNYAIGKNGKLPWHYPSDLKFFRETTTGNAIVMGRKTYESIGKALPKRLNLVFSRSQMPEGNANVFVADSREKILILGEFLKGDVYIIGGAQTYAQFAEVIEKWIVTEVPEIIRDADAFMPENFLENFEVVEKKQLETDLFVKIYERKVNEKFG